MLHCYIDTGMPGEGGAEGMLGDLAPPGLGLPDGHRAGYSCCAVGSEPGPRCSLEGSSNHTDVHTGHLRPRVAKPVFKRTC